MILYSQMCNVCNACNASLLLAATLCCCQFSQESVYVLRKVSMFLGNYVFRKNNINLSTFFRKRHVTNSEQCERYTF